MARKNDRDMRRIILVFVMGLLMSVSCFAQEDVYLKKLTDDLIQLRKVKASNDALNKTVLEWSASGNPKITLMDEIRRDENNEYRGSGTNKFKMNQVITHVYRRQNTGMTSKGDYFNSTEKDIFYSAIEKNVKKKSTVSYTLTGHVGEQEFVLVSYNANTFFSVKVNDTSAQPVSGKKGVLYLKLPRVKKEDKMVFSITNNSNSNESFVIMNHNPQK